MAKKSSLIFDSLSFEMRYAFGHSFFDRCGQILVDIERGCEGWISSEATAQGGMLNRPDKDYSVSFNNNQFNFSVRRAFKLELDEIAKEVNLLWRIVRANLNVDEFIRIGSRFFYLLPTRSIAESEKFIKKSNLNIQYPENIINEGYEVFTRHMHTSFKKDGVEYMINLEGIRRAYGMDPSKLAVTDPKTLHIKQREARLAELQRVSEYSIDPMYGVQLDADCVIYEPEEDISIEDFILSQHGIFMTDFYPIIGEL